MYYAGEPYDRVLQQLRAQLGEPEFFVRLTGKKGSGKSALLEQIVRYHTEQGYLTRYFPTNPDSPMALRSALRKSFGMEKAHNFQRSLQEHLVSEALLYDASKGLPQYLSEIAALCSNLYRSQELSSSVGKSDLAQVLKHPSLAARRLSRNRPAPSHKIMVSVAAAAAALALLATAWTTPLPKAPSETAPLSPMPIDTAVMDNLAELSREILPPVELIDAPDADPAPSTQPINQPAFETVAETVPETTAETATETAAETTAETASDTLAQTSAEPAPATTPELVVDTVSEQTSDSTPGLLSPEQTLQNRLAAWHSRH